MYDEPPGARPFPHSLKLGLLSNWLQNGRKQINNLNSQGAYATSAAKLIDDAWMLVAQASSKARQAAPTKESKAACAQAMCDASAAMWALAAGFEIAEEVDAGWLSKYLVYDVGVTYVAFEQRDLLFAIKDLFGLPPVVSYDEAPEVWRRLAVIAGIEHWSPFSWLRNLSRPGPNLSLVARHTTFVRAQDQDELLAYHGCSARQFGVFGLDETDQRTHSGGGGGGGGGPKGFVSALTLEEVKDGGWLVEDDSR